MLSIIHKRWFAMPAMLLIVIIAAGFLAASACADDAEWLEPNTEDHPYILAYEQSVRLTARPDNERKGQKWFAYLETGGTVYNDFASATITNRNISDSAKSLEIVHRHNLVPGQGEEHYYFTLLPPVHYHVVFDANNETETVTGMPEGYVDAWQKKDGKIVVKIPNTRPVRKGKVFGGWAKHPNDNADVMPGGTFVFDESETYENKITLFALWYNNATVRYKAEGNGSVSPESEAGYVYDISGLKGAVATGNTGYECEGWYKDGQKIADGPTLTPELVKANMNSHQEQGGQTAYEDTTFTARFRPVEYTITYDLDGGSESVYYPLPKSYTIETYDLLIYWPYKDGFHWVGWTGAGIDQPARYTKIPKGSVGNREYKANWTPIPENNYLVQFVDGQGNVLDSQMVKEGESAAAPADPKRDGYAFNGWDTDFSVVITDLTVTARWKQVVVTHQVIFEDGRGNVLDTQTVIDGRAASAPPVPVKEGCIFSGWDEDFSCVTSDLTVAAVWTDATQEEGKYIVVFVRGFGLDPVARVVSLGESATAPAVPEVDGFTFTGWDKEFTNITGNLTVTARWKKKTADNEHTVVFSDGYNSGKAPRVQRVKDGQPAKPPADPEREGYTFAGWDTDFSCVTENLIVIAQWKQNEILPIPSGDPARVITAPTGKNLTYTGSAQELVTAGTAEGGMIQYAIGTEAGATEPYAASIPTGIDTGTYYVWYMAKGDETHRDSEPACVSAAIAEKSDPDAEPADRVAAFVTRCYAELLGRKPDQNGLDYWVKQLKAKDKSAAECIYAFLTSKEFAARGRSAQQVIESLYRAMMGRPAEAKGLAFWLDKMKNGADYADLVNGFCRSIEFRNVCAGLGIIPGSVRGSDGIRPDPAAAIDIQQIEAFLTRCYRLMLGRNPDPVGLKYWTDAMANGTSAAEVVYGFMTSKEQTGKQLSARQTVQILYQTMLDRQPEEKGMAYWLGCIDRGDNLAAIVNGFCESNEFKNICAKYGMKPGKVAGAKKGSDTETAETWDGEKVRAFIARIYKAAFGREAAESETDYWTAKILNGKVSPKQAVKEIMTSTEFGAQGIQGEELIKAAYRVYMNREADATGLAYWTARLNEGTSVAEMLDGFAASAEFAAVVAGLN